MCGVWTSRTSSFFSLLRLSHGPWTTHVERCVRRVSRWRCLMRSVCASPQDQEPGPSGPLPGVPGAHKQRVSRTKKNIKAVYWQCINRGGTVGTLASGTLERTRSTHITVLHSRTSGPLLMLGQLLRILYSWASHCNLGAAMALGPGWQATRRHATGTGAGCDGGVERVAADAQGRLG